MRESIGGSMLFYIVLFFLTIFIFFIASVIRYARVYKVKNSLINYIERSEGVENQGEIDNQLKAMNYKGEYKICRLFPSQQGGYYSVELYARFELPVVSNWMHIDVAIKGDTSTITTGTKVKAVVDLFPDENAGNEQCKVCVVGGSCT